MSEDVFARSLYWLREFKQQEVQLHGIGESTLHPRFLEYLDRTTDVVPHVFLSTNGVGVTRDTVRGMKEAGLEKLTLSIHRPEVVQKTREYCEDEGLAFDWGSGPVSSPHNFAGQVKADIRNSEWAKTYECTFLDQQEPVVLSDGRLSTCCIDAEGLAPIGTVFDDLRQQDLLPFSLCKGCHHIVPARFQKLEEVALVN